MPRIIETTVYTIDELSGAAKENARIWYRDQGLHDEWYDFVYEDFETICRIIGITLATTPVRLYGGGTRDKPQVYGSAASASARRWRQLRRPLLPRQGSRQVHPRPRAEGRPNCTASPMSCRRFSGSNFFQTSRVHPPDRADIATSTAWRSRSSATAQPGSR